ncbi:MAG: hypothetical protein QOF77_1161 [Solirubrobacteraceae bacterium]|jgi:hypothetical protein|nr:hypothetical protein [Solirubrobacteraceae bacterium]
MVRAVRGLKSSTLILAALVLVGCGSSGSTNSTSSTRSTGTGPAASDRASYIARADALCKSSNARQEALRKKAKGLVVRKLPPILRQQAQIADGLSSGLGRLSPPPGDRATVGRFVRSVRQLAVYSRAVANSIAANHAFAARALATKLSLARQQETLLGQGYGYKVCSSGKSY